MRQRYQAREIFGALTDIGPRFINAFAIRGQDRENGSARGARNPDAKVLREKESKAKTEAQKARPGLITFTDAPQMENGLAGYAVVCKGV